MLLGVDPGRTGAAIIALLPDTALHRDWCHCNAAVCAPLNAYRISHAQCTSLNTLNAYRISHAQCTSQRIPIFVNQACDVLSTMHLTAIQVQAIWYAVCGVC